MKLHRYRYGPTEKGGLTLEATPELSQAINEDLTTRLYTMDGNPRRKIQFSEIYQTTKGPVLGITPIEPMVNHDNRATTQNKTIFVRLAEIVEDLLPFLDENVVPNQTQKAKITLEG
mgnify:CR=1 FL=1